MFKRIGDLFGGLLEVDRNTSKYFFLFYTKLKIKRSRHDYFNSSFDCYLNNKTYFFSVRNSSSGGGAFSSHESIMNERPRTNGPSHGWMKVS